MQSGGPAILFSYSASLYHSWVHCCCIKSLFSLSFLWFCHSDKKREKSKRKKPPQLATQITLVGTVWRKSIKLSSFSLAFLRYLLFCPEGWQPACFFSSIIQQFAAICKNHKNTSITKNLTLLLNIHLCKKPNKSFQNSDTWRKIIPGKRHHLILHVCFQRHDWCVDVLLFPRTHSRF